MRAMICVDMESQETLSRLIETMVKYVTLCSIQIDDSSLTSGQAHVTVRLFGQMELTMDGRTLQLGRTKACELLAFLLLNGGSANRDALCDALWPQSSPRQAQACLHTTVSFLRKQIGATCMSFQSPRYLLNDQTMVWQTDIDTFFRLSDQKTEAELLQAERLSTGLLLDGMEAAWIIPYRTQAEQRSSAVLFALATYAEQRREYVHGRELYHLLISRNPLDEQACAGIMRCCIALHQRAEAIEHFHRLRAALDEELGLLIDERSEAYQLYMQLLRGT